MKKAILASILGIAVVANTFGQGSIIFDNYTQGTYNQVVWGDPPHLTAVTDPITLQLYYGKGTGYTDISQLTVGVTGAVDPTRTFVGAYGPGGWFSGATQVLPTWAPGDTFTFAVVVTGPGDYAGHSLFWTETAAIHPTASSQSGFLNFPGLNLTIPEPSSFAVVSVAGAVLFTFRRRKT
jgi:hypothetical protein